MSASPAGSPGDDGSTRLEVFESLPPDLVEAVSRLVDAATEADGVHPLSEHVMLHLRLGGEGPDRHLLILDRGTVVGYAHLDPTDTVAGSAAEIVVRPDRRRRGLGRRLVTAVAAQAPDDRLRLWAHGDQPAARALAGSLGLPEARRLEQWRRSLYSPLPRAGLPDGVVLRTFRPGEDDEEWLALNARAFAGHPEQGTWTARDLHARMGEAWFDHEGFLVADEDGAMAGFHWTKVHGARRAGGDASHHAHDPIGEVYVVGVDPGRQGRGLGRALTVAGLAWLRARGLPQAMLYVESDNAPARATYRGLGFAPWDTDVMFSRGARGERSPSPGAPPAVT
ncbi:MAG: mycothiol synthase [Actinomycetota bacterium]|nr:mycothiol synthase [Actinomycetota bacterium]